jgi:hypothetical protein
MSGLVKRPLYKAERRPARMRGVIKKGGMSPVAMPSANLDEITLALSHLCREAGVRVGRAGSYDPLKDVYTVVGKSLHTGKAQDFTIEGAEVAQTIAIMRMMNGGPLLRLDKKPSSIVLR